MKIENVKISIDAINDGTFRLNLYQKDSEDISCICNITFDEFTEISNLFDLSIDQIIDDLDQSERE